MATEWYLMGSMPVYNSGFEQEEFDAYATDSFAEILATSPITKTIQIVNHDLTLVLETSAVVLNNVTDSVTKSVERQILTTIGTLHCGDYIKYENSIWLINSLVGNNGIYEKAIAQLCNYTIKFQSANGTIFSYPVLFEGTNGMSIDENKVISTNSKDFKVRIIRDDETIKIKHDKRFLCDIDTDEPTAYIVTGRDVLSENRGETGIIILTLKADEFNPTKDNKLLMIADYFSPTVTTPDESGILSYSKIVCNNPQNEVVIGSSSFRTLTFTAYEEDGSINTTILPTWTFDWNGMSSSDFTIEYAENKVNIKVKKNWDLLGRTFTVNASDGNNKYKGSLVLTIVM